MIKNKNKLWIATILVIILLCSFFVLTGFTHIKSVYAATNEYFSSEEYTDNDRLLKSDGDLSNKKIDAFASEVKVASNGTSFPELTQVIPRQYLESTETSATYQYNGKEYGFYVAKEGNYFDVLLIDFVYEFENGEAHSDIEYKIRIKPMLQQTFKRSQNSNGDYVWQKTGNNYTYYVANPRFLVTVQNENSLNYGDSGYSKANDDGVIILRI